MLFEQTKTKALMSLLEAQEEARRGGGVENLIDRLMTVAVNVVGAEHVGLFFCDW